LPVFFSLLQSGAECAEEIVDSPTIWSTYQVVILASIGGGVVFMGLCIAYYCRLRKDYKMKKEVGFLFLLALVLFVRNQIFFFFYFQRKLSVVRARAAKKSYIAEDEDETAPLDDKTIRHTRSGLEREIQKLQNDSHGNPHRKPQAVPDPDRPSHLSIEMAPINHR
jgi:hypothetical protein